MARWEPDAERRLIKAAITLFDRQGYDRTTVAEITHAAGLTKRTFFRYFADKREVLFTGSQELQQCWVHGIDATATGGGADPMTAVLAGLLDVSGLFADRHPFAVIRSRIIADTPELQERELIKLHTVTQAVRTALIHRGVPDNDATVAAHAGVTVFHLAFARWVGSDSPPPLARFVDDALDDLRTITGRVHTAATAPLRD